MPTRDVALTASRLRDAVRRLAIDILVAQVCLAVFVVYGFAALDLGPRAYGREMAALGAAVALLAPRCAWRQVRIALSIRLLLGWWVLCYMWAPTPQSWTSVTWETIPAVLAVTAVAAIVPFERAIPGLLIGCYVAIGWSLLTLVIDPTTAITNPDFTTGVRGSFPHRNNLGIFLAFALPTIAALERRRAWRAGGLAAGVGMLILSRSVTGNLTALVVALAALWLQKFRALQGRAARTFAATTAAVAVIVPVLTVYGAPVIVPLLGKDLSLTGRTRVWRAVWHAVQGAPFVGYGVGAWREYKRPPVTDIVGEIWWYPHHAHNGLLELLLLLGGFGTLIYLAIVLETLVGAWRGRADHPDLSRWTLLVIVMMVAASISETPVLGPWLAILAFARTAARAAALRRDTGRCERRATEVG